MPGKSSSAPGKNKITVKPVTGTSLDDVLDLSGETIAQRINGGDGNDQIFGGSGADRINGGDGDDVVRGGAGDDVMFGNDGTDTAVFGGSILDYVWSAGQGGSLNVSGDDGNDTLKHFEILQFDDFVFDLGGNNGPHVTGSDQTTDEDNAVSFAFNAYDFDGDAMTASVSMTSAGAAGLLLPTVNIVGTSALSPLMGSGVEYTIQVDPGAAYQYLAVNETVTETVTIDVTDAQGAVTSFSRDITITGVNDGPSADDDSGSVTEDGTLIAAGDLNATDPDASDTLSFSVSDNGVGTYGALSVNPDGTWSYALSNGAANVQALNGTDVFVESFTVTVDDGNGGVTTADVDVTVNGSNDDPTAQDGSGSVTEDGTEIATGSLNAADVDNGDTLSYSVSGNGVGTYGSLAVDANGDWSYQLNNAAANVQALNGGDVVSDSFTVTVDDGNGGTTTADVNIAVNGADDIVDTGATNIMDFNAWSHYGYTEDGMRASLPGGGHYHMHGSYMQLHGGSSYRVRMSKQDNTTFDADEIALLWGSGTVVGSNGNSYSLNGNGTHDFGNLFDDVAWIDISGNIGIDDFGWS